MFTGLIETIASVARLDLRESGYRVRFDTPLAPELQLGESVAVDGVCLTVTSRDAAGWEADIGPETARVTTLGSLGIQSVVLEGGAMLHGAAWDEDVVDAVQLYVAPVSLGRDGVRLLDGRAFVSTALLERRVDLLGPDVLIEGYVHRPH